MERLLIPESAWLLVCDGTKFLIFRNRGDEAHVDLRVVDTAESQEHLGTANSIPGRIFQSVGSARSAHMPESKQKAEERFLRDLAEKLDKSATTGVIEHLTIVAPPRALGYLRKTLSDPVKDVLKGTVDEDWVHLWTPEIEAHLAQHRALE